MKDDRLAIIGLLFVIATLPVIIPTPHDNAGMAIETKGSNVQSSTHNSEARFDTSINRSFQLVSSVFTVGELLYSIEKEDRDHSIHVGLDNG